MNWTDYIIIAIIALSVLIGLWRGLISEVLALAIWIVAFWVAWTFGPSVAAHFDPMIKLPSVRIIVGYGLCFVVVLILGALLRFAISRLVVKPPWLWPARMKCSTFSLPTAPTTRSTMLCRYSSSAPLQ